MEEFAKSLKQRQVNAFIRQSHSQTYYKSRLLKKVNETLEQEKEIVISSNSVYIIEDFRSDCLDCEIIIMATKK